jgi:hypothetical protein
MNRCKDCKHWGVSGWDGQQQGPEAFGDKRRCDRLKLSGMTDVDTGGAPDTIGTSPDFGCVLFEPAMPSVSEPARQS